MEGSTYPTLHWPTEVQLHPFKSTVPCAIGWTTSIGWCASNQEARTIGGIGPHHPAWHRGRGVDVDGIERPGLGAYNTPWYCGDCVSASS